MFLDDLENFLNLRAAEIIQNFEQFFSENYFNVFWWSDEPKNFLNYTKLRGTLLRELLKGFLMIIRTFSTYKSQSNVSWWSQELSQLKSYQNYTKFGASLIKITFLNNLKKSRNLSALFPNLITQTYEILASNFVHNNTWGALNLRL